MAEQDPKPDTLKKPIDLAEGDALVVVDVQNCFLPGGSLGVSGGDQVIDPLNHAIKVFSGKKLPVFFSRDWHPPKHASFRMRGGPWPDHCVQNTEGAEFSPLLRIPADALIFSKGTDPEREEYSAWSARDDDGRTLHHHLARLGVRRLFIGGLTAEYCVLSTVRDARKEGYEIYVFLDAVRAVNAGEGDDERAFSEMASEGAGLILEKDIRS